MHKKKLHNFSQKLKIFTSQIKEIFLNFLLPLFSLPFLLLTDQLFTVEWQALYYSNRFYIANCNDALPKRMSMPMLREVKSFFHEHFFCDVRKKISESSLFL